MKLNCRRKNTKHSNKLTLKPVPMSSFSKRSVIMPSYSPFILVIPSYQFILINDVSHPNSVLSPTFRVVHLSFPEFVSSPVSTESLTKHLDADQAAVQTHLTAPYFGAAGEILAKEGLVTKPFEIIVLNPIGGFASRV